MRLRNIYAICKKNIEIIDDFKPTTNKSNSSLYDFCGWEKISGILKDEIIPIKYLEIEATEFMDSVPAVYRTRDAFSVNTTDKNKILDSKRALYNCMVDAINLYESMDLKYEEGNGIDIKLPNCEDFSDLKKYISEIEFILFRCPFFNIENESLKFEAFDVGSLWLTFACVGAGALTFSVILNNLAAFLDKCIILKSHYLTVQTQEKTLESIQMEEKEKQIIIKGINDVYKAQVKNAIKELEELTNIQLKNGEEEDVVERAFEKANALMDKGMQIYSTIESNKENKALFEPVKMQYISIEENLKLLEKRDTE